MSLSCTSVFEPFCPRFLAVNFFKNYVGLVLLNKRVHVGPLLKPAKLKTNYYSPGPCNPRKIESD